jgi:hypothetical protein
MPPQPLSRVHPKARVLGGPETLYTHRPRFAPLAIAVIAHWSEIEAKTAAILAFVLHAEAAPISAMLQAINSASARIKAIECAGQIKLKGQELEVFEVVMWMAKKAAAHRHPIAHHIWAFCQELPDAVLLVEPSAYIGIFVALATTDGPGTLHEPDKRLVKVYRERDFQDAILEMKTVANCLDKAMWILNGRHPVSPQTYAELSAEPMFREALKAIQKARPRSTK